MRIKLRNILIQILNALLCLSASNQANATDYPGTATDSLLLEGRELADRYQSRLKQQLQAGIMTSGPVQAIKMCRQQAPGIANSMSSQTGWTIRRVSTRNRNPDNYPDPWEKNVLKMFETKASNGAPIDNLEHGERVIINDQPAYRYMKAISVQQVCLNCHGQYISTPVMQTLRSLYPQDKATGYKPGDLRGAFSFYKITDTSK